MERHPLVSKMIAITDETLKETPEQRALKDLQDQVESIIGDFKPSEIKETPLQKQDEQPYILKSSNDLAYAIEPYVNEFGEEYVFIGAPEQYPCLLFVLSADGGDAAAVQGLFIYRSHLKLLNE